MPDRTVQTVDQLAETLRLLDEPLRYDVRGQLMVRPTGEGLSEQALRAIIARSFGQPYPELPGLSGDRDRSLWSGYQQTVAFDPLVEWLEDCRTDHDPDLFRPEWIPERLWPDRIGTPHSVQKQAPPVDAQLVRWCWQALCLAVVARAYSPPVRWDVVPIILGPQGCGKSTGVTSLLPKQWTNGGFPLRGVKDFDAARKTVEFTEGKAILESSEMVGVSGGAREALKSFLTQDTDRATRKYARQADDIPRRWVIVGTTNDMQPIPYDPTGGRRWIVTPIVGSHPDDGERIHQHLTEHRRAYWAAAVAEYETITALGGSEAVNSALSIPAHLRDLHDKHIRAYMWKPNA